MNRSWTARLIALAFGLGSLAAGVLAQWGRTNARLDLLGHFAPVWLAVALATALLALAGTRGAWRVSLLALAFLGAAFSASLLAPEFARPIRPAVGGEGAPRLRLIQFNSWDANIDPARTADWIAAQHPDVVTIEEVTPVLRLALEARGLRYTKGMVSAAIFSRAPPAPAPFMVPQPFWRVLPDFARATFNAPGGAGAFSVIAVHLNRPTIAESAGQPGALVRFLTLYPQDRLIMAGDFNRTPWSFDLRRLDDRFALERLDRALPTWPARLWVKGRRLRLPPLLPIDHVYVGRAWRLVALRRGPPMGSDHYPLVVDLALED